MMDYLFDIIVAITNYLFAAAVVSYLFVAVVGLLVAVVEMVNC